MRIKLLSALLVVVALSACASWQSPAPVDQGEYRARATVREHNGITVRALMLTRADGALLFGADVFSLGIEPVWIEIQNDSDQPVTLLHSGTDPDYFSPLEVSWSLHGGLSQAGKSAVDEHIQAVAFRRGPLHPGESRSGALFTNPHHGVKFLNIDLLGENRFIPFSLFLPIPDEEGNISESRPWRFSSDQMTDYEEEQAFKQAMGDWFTGTLMGAGHRLTEPLTLVWVGRPRDMGAALVRRGYRWDPLDHDLEQRLLGEPPHFVLRKAGQGGVPANWIRLWALPMTFQGRPVLVGQAGAPRGGRFAAEWGEARTDPALDEARDMVVQDMLYSGRMAKLAVLQRQKITANFEQLTDGRIAVLFVAARPVGLADVLISDWESVHWAVEPEPYGLRRAGD